MKHEGVVIAVVAAAGLGITFGVRVAVGFLIGVTIGTIINRSKRR